MADQGETSDGTDTRIDQNHPYVKACRRLLGDVRGTVAGPKALPVRSRRDAASSELCRLAAGTVVFILEIDESELPERLHGLIVSTTTRGEGGADEGGVCAPNGVSHASGFDHARGRTAGSLVEGWVVLKEGSKPSAIDTRARLDASARAEAVKHWGRQLRTDRDHGSTRLLGPSGPSASPRAKPTKRSPSAKHAMKADAKEAAKEAMNAGGLKVETASKGQEDEIEASAASTGSVETDAHGGRRPKAIATSSLALAANLTVVHEPSDSRSPFIEELKLSSDPLGFSYGGAYPGALHSKGALFDSHKVRDPHEPCV